MKEDRQKMIYIQAQGVGEEPCVQDSHAWRERREVAVDHTWDLTDEEVLENRGRKYVENDRIGLRLMGVHKLLFRNFKVERLK